MIPAGLEPATCGLEVRVIGHLFGSFTGFKSFYVAFVSRLRVDQILLLTALILGNVFLDEQIHSKEIIGALIIGAGLLFIDGRVINRLTGKHAAAN